HGPSVSTPSSGLSITVIGPLAGAAFGVLVFIIAICCYRRHRKAKHEEFMNRVHDYHMHGGANIPARMGMPGHMRMPANMSMHSGRTPMPYRGQPRPRPKQSINDDTPLGQIQSAANRVYAGAADYYNQAASKWSSWFGGGQQEPQAPPEARGSLPDED